MATKWFSLDSSRQVAWLAAVLTVIRLTAACEAAPLPGRANELSLAIVKVGRLAVGQEARDEAPGANHTDFFMRQKEPLVFRVSSALPPRTRLYLLVRQEGENAWNVQRVTNGPGERNAAGEWTTEVELGWLGDLGKRFEVQVVAAGESLPSLLSDDMRAKTLLAGSSVIEVERRHVRPSVAITEILASAPVAMGSSPPDPQYVYGDEELMVHDESLVVLAAHDLPAGSQAGVAVQPASSDERWVMDDFLEGTKPILAHFGAGDGSEKSFHYRVSAFVASGDALPPAGRGISSAEWKEYQSQLLAESPAVRVVRWQRELKIEEIGGAPVQPGRTLVIDRQVNVHGAAKRKLEPGERIWLVCVPLQGNPWVAQSTPWLTPSGHWEMKAVQFRKDAKPEPFDVIAVVSAENASKIRPEALRWWLDTVESGDSSTRVSVSTLRTGMP